MNKKKREKRQLPGDDKFGVTGGEGAPFAAADGPFALAETDQSLALGADRVEDRDQIAGAVGHVETARHHRFVDVHRIGILEAREARSQQIHYD